MEEVERVGVMLMEPVMVRLPPARDTVMLEVAQKVEVRVGESVPVPLRVVVTVEEGERVPEGQWEEEGVVVGVGVGCTLPPTVKVREGEGVKVALAEVQAVPVREREMECVTLLVMEAEAVGERVTLVQALEEKEGVAVAQLLCVGEGVRLLLGAWARC